jgi:hypothetical protein
MHRKSMVVAAVHMLWSYNLFRITMYTAMVGLANGNGHKYESYYGDDGSYLVAAIGGAHVRKTPRYLCAVKAHRSLGRVSPLPPSNAISAASRARKSPGADSRIV